MLTWLRNTDAMFGVTVKNAFRLYDRGTDKWYLLTADSPSQRQRWMQAFEDERQRVATDRLNGFSVDVMKRPVFTRNTLFLNWNTAFLYRNTMFLSLKSCRPVFTKKKMKRVRVNRQKGSSSHNLFILFI